MVVLVGVGRALLSWEEEEEEHGVEEEPCASQFVVERLPVLAAAVRSCCKGLVAIVHVLCCFVA